ncbi:uncharacterized protein LOC135402418 isoform X2 [Pseudopipra pipra]|uniref:uncharacterized protein LOC135402418 isoform X2 n=1 Tax=Pseudopipra pipra TaxID=415032 RepID=UPI0031388AE1
MARKAPPRRRRGSARRCLGCEDEVAEVTVELRSSCADAPLTAALVNLHLERVKEIARMFLRQICQLADDLVFLGRNRLSPYILKAQKMVRQKKSFKVYALLLSVYLVGVFCGTSLPAWTLLTKGLMQELTSVFPAGLKTFWNSDTLTENQKLQLLLEELSQELTKMTLESYVKTDWALKSSGATIDTQRTSQTYDCRESWVCRILYFFWTANPPDTILQEAAGLSVGIRARWSSSCQHESTLLPSQCSTSPRTSLQAGPSSVPPRTSLPLEWMQPEKRNLSWGHSPTTWKKSPCRLSL